MTLTAATILAATHPALAAEPALPETVLAQVGPRPVTRAEFERQWARFASPPTAGSLEERQRAFLDELVNKELLTLATSEMSYVPGPEEEARLGLTRLGAMRQAYYRLMVVDSLPPAPAPDAHGHGGVDEEEQARLQRAAEERLIHRLIGPLRPQWDDSVAAFLARAFGKLPKPKEEGVGWVRWNYTAWMPPVAPADSSRELGRSALGPFTVGRFLSHWAQVPAAQRDRPDSAAGVVQWAENFLAQGVLDQEARRLGLDHAPEVEAEVAKQRQLFALDAYYRAHVSVAVDTSEKRLRAAWAKSPRAFDGQPSVLYEAVWYRRFDEAAAAVRALARGARWDSVLAARFPLPADPEEARLVNSERDLYRNPQALLPTSPDTTLDRLFRGARRGASFGPRDRAGQWWVYRFLERRDGKRRTFQAARSFVAEKLAYDDEEKRLTEHLLELRGRYAVRVNEAAMRALAAREPR